MKVYPEDWEIKSLGELSKVKRGASPRPIKNPKWWGGDVGWVRISDVTASKKYLTKTKNKLSDEGVSKSVRIKKGELILSICATIGRPIIVDTDACIHDGFVWFENLSKEVSREYFYYFLSAQEEKLSSSRQIGTQGNLNTDIVSRLQFPLPPLAEQKKIANILSTVDEKIALIDNQIEETETLKKGLMQKLLTEGIGHGEFKDSEIGRIPVGWGVVRLEKVAILSKAKFTPNNTESFDYIGLEHMNQEKGTINGIGNSNETLSTKNIFDKGDILFGKLRPYLRKFYLADFKGVCSTEILVIKNKNNIFNSFLFKIIQTEEFIEHSVSKVFGTKMPRTS